MSDDDGDLALLPELIDRSFGTGPDGLPAPAERLAAGRRALRRRRRLTVGAASVGVVAAVGVGAALSGAGGEHGADVPAPLATSVASPSADASQATPPTEAPTQSPATATPAPPKSHKQQQRHVSEMFPASLDTDGTVVVKDGWHITEQVEEPVGLLPPEKSVGVVVQRGDHVRWMLLELKLAQDAEGHDKPGTWSLGASADDPGAGYSRYEDWLASQVELQGGPKTQPLVVVDADDTLRPGPGAQLIETRPAPAIRHFTDGRDRLAEVVRDGRTWFVVVRGHGPDADVEPVDAAVLSAPTFEALVDHMATQVASGEGLR